MKTIIFTIKPLNIISMRTMKKVAQETVGNVSLVTTPKNVFFRKEMTMVPYRPKKNIIMEDGKPLEKVTKTHSNSYDDLTKLSTTAFTRSPIGPNGEKNPLLTKNLIQPGKSLHSKGLGQYTAKFKRTLKIDLQHVDIIKDLNTEVYFKTNQKAIQAIHDKNVKQNSAKGKKPVKTKDPTQKNSGTKNASKLKISDTADNTE